MLQWTPLYRQIYRWWLLHIMNPLLNLAEHPLLTQHTPQFTPFHNNSKWLFTGNLFCSDKSLVMSEELLLWCTIVHFPWNSQPLAPTSVVLLSSETSCMAVSNNLALTCLPLPTKARKQMCFSVGMVHYLQSSFVRTVYSFSPSLYSRWQCHSVYTDPF